MPLISISGWIPGFRKVSHMEVLRAHAEMSLAEAKAATDRVLGGTHVVFAVSSQAAAEAVTAELVELGAVAQIVAE